MLRFESKILTAFPSVGKVETAKWCALERCLVAQSPGSEVCPNTHCRSGADATPFFGLCFSHSNNYSIEPDGGSSQLPKRRNGHGSAY